MATYYWNGSAWATTDSGFLYTSKITYFRSYSNVTNNSLRVAYKVLWNDSTKKMTLQYWLNVRNSEINANNTYYLSRYTGHDSSDRYLKILSGSTTVKSWTATTITSTADFLNKRDTMVPVYIASGSYNNTANSNDGTSILMPWTQDVTSYAGTSLTPDISLDFYRTWTSGGYYYPEWDYAVGSLSNGLPVPSLYSVTYNANGGSGAPSATKGVGSTTLSSSTPTRSGYTFAGWNTKADGTGTSYATGATLTLTSNLTLYAKWQQSTFTIKYYANGGSGTMSNTTGNGSVTLRSNTFTRTGYNFIGWATSSGSTTVVYTNGQTITLSANLNLYAVWQLATYTIAYNANGGSGAPASQTKTYGVTLVLSSTKPSRADSSPGSYTVTLKANYTGGTDPTALTATRTTKYTFSKWNTASNGSGTDYAPGANYTANAAATLYAQWTSNTTTAAVTLPTLTRSQYTFLGWATSASATTANYSGGASYTPVANVTLYAVWRANASTVNASNGTVGTAMNITISQQGSSYSYKHTLKWTVNGTTGTIASNITGSSATITQSWTPAIATIVPLYTDRKSYPCTITLQTYASDGTTLIGTTTKSITLAVPSSCAPTLSGSVTPTNNPSGLTAKYVTGKSKAYFSYTATPQYNATIVSWTWTYNGTSTTETSSATTKTYTTPNAVTASALSVSVTDSRGLTRTASTTATLLAYSAPTLTGITLARADSGGTLDSQGEYLKAVATATITSLDSKNTKTYKIEYRLESASTWTTLVNTSTLSNYTQSISYLSSSAILNESYSYVARITITDYYGSATATLTISTALSIMDFKSNGLGVAFGKVHTAADKTVEIADTWKLLLGSRDINLLADNLLIDAVHSNEINIDTYNRNQGYIIRCGTNVGGTIPSGIGTFLLIGFTNISGGLLIQGKQIAIGITNNSITVRNAPYNANGSVWSTWEYIYGNPNSAENGIPTEIIQATSASLATAGTHTVDSFTLPAGKYLIEANAVFSGGTASRRGFRVTTSTTLNLATDQWDASVSWVGSSANHQVRLSYPISISSSTTFTCIAYTQSASVDCNYKVRYTLL